MADRPEASITIRRGLALASAAELVIGAADTALAQSSTTPPPTAPSAVPMGGMTSAPADPGEALPAAGKGSGASSSDAPDKESPPLKNDTPPPGVTKAGQ